MYHASNTIKSAQSLPDEQFLKYNIIIMLSNPLSIIIRYTDIITLYKVLNDF